MGSKWTLRNDGYDYFDYDYVLLKLDKPYTINSTVQLRLNFDSNLPAIGDNLTLCGMGQGNFPNHKDKDGKKNKKSVDYLHFAIEQYQYTNTDCNLKSKNGVKMWNGAVTARQLCWPERCLKKMEICAGLGDSGGPLVKIEGNIHVQVGVVSYGSENGEKPDIFARVSKFCDFTKKWVCDKWKSASSPKYICDSAC